MQKPKVFGITGVSCAGKTTLCNAICASSQSRVVAVVSQDNFYKTDAQICDASYNWDVPAAFDWDALMAEVERCMHLSNVICVLVEGIVLLTYAPLVALFDRVVMLRVNVDVCRSRRTLRTYRTSSKISAVWREPSRYFDTVALPAFEFYTTAAAKGNRLVVEKTWENAFEFLMGEISTAAK